MAKVEPGALKVEAWFWRLWPIVVMAAICFPFWPLNRMYPQDWENQLWLLSYQACHIAESGLPAAVYNYKETVGLGTALFYGALIYPYGGLLTLALGANLAFRAMILGVFCLQYSSIIRLGRSYGWPQRLRHLVATLMLWAVYPLTNLYWRGATAELWAWAFFVSAICSLIQVLRNPTGPETRYDRVAWGFYFVWAASTHVLTGILGAGLVAILCCAGLWGQNADGRRQIIWQVLCSGIAGAMVQLSWIYLMVSFGSSLTVANPDNSIRPFLEMTRIYTGAIDWSGLLSPFSPSVTYMHLPLRDEVGLEIFMGVRISVALAFLLLGVVWVTWAAKSLQPWRFLDQFLVILGFTMGGFSFAIMGWPDFGKHFAFILGVIQFPYRLANYANLALFLLIIALLARPILWRVERRNRLQLIGCIALALAVLSVWSKMSGVSAIISPKSGDRYASAFTSDPTGSVPSYYGRSDYAITRWNVEQPVTAETPRAELVTRLDRMDVADATITIPTTSWVRTQAELFPWDQFWLDGRLLPLSDVRYYHVVEEPRQLGCAIEVPAGTHHLEFRFVPPLWWQVTRQASFILVAIWGGIVIWVGCAGVWKSFRK